MAKKELSASAKKTLIETLQKRFEKNASRHKNIEWKEVQSKLDKSGKLWTLQQMEESGGEPDVVSFAKGEIAFVDCSAESPAGRRSLCYDDEALEARKEAKPAGSATGIAEEMGIELLTEEEYFKLQKLGKFDLKTSSWLKTEPAVRKLGGAVFGDRRYDRVFIYHNGVQSYYAARGFRGKLKL